MAGFDRSIGNEPRQNLAGGLICCISRPANMLGIRSRNK